MENLGKFSVGNIVDSIPSGSLGVALVPNGGSYSMVATSSTGGGGGGGHIDHKDSGWRDVTSACLDTTVWKSGKIYARRENDIVTIKFDNLKIQDNPSGSRYLQKRILKSGIGAGFNKTDWSPLYNQSALVNNLISQVFSTDNSDVLGISANGGNWSTNDTVSGYIGYYVKSEFPNTLPGIAAPEV